MAQYVFTMNGVGKVVPPKKEILKDIYLNFFPGAKIGVLGYNGAGKSTLLRIMAGIDQDYIGEARPQNDLKIGYLAQEPQLDMDLDVRGNVELGIAPLKQALDAFNAISMKFAEPMTDDEMSAALEQQATLQDQIEAADGWNVERTLEVAADALHMHVRVLHVKVVARRGVGDPVECRAPSCSLAAEALREPGQA